VVGFLEWAVVLTILIAKDFGIEAHGEFVDF